MAVDVDRVRLLVTGLDASGIGVSVQAGVYLQARVNGDRRDQVDDLGTFKRLLRRLVALKVISSPGLATAPRLMAGVGSR